eukprot:COSAG01_NODE_86_length_27623_cov_39.847224_12_plen_78_part_00
MAPPTPDTTTVAVMAIMAGLCVYNGINPGSEDIGEGESYKCGNRYANKRKEAAKKWNGRRDTDGNKVMDAKTHDWSK